MEEYIVIKVYHYTPVQEETNKKSIKMLFLIKRGKVVQIYKLICVRLTLVSIWRMN